MNTAQDVTLCHLMCGTSSWVFCVAAFALDGRTSAQCLSYRSWPSEKWKRIRGGKDLFGMGKTSCKLRRWEVSAQGRS